MPLPIFIGLDQRQPISFQVLAHSIFTRSSKPVSIVPLRLETLPLTRVGLTPFTYSRFLVPWLMGYQGTGLFLDSDIIVLGDIAELFDCADGSAVQVVKSASRFEWASVMMFNSGHEKNRILTPEYVQDAEKCKTPHMIDWCGDENIGDLPKEWNHIVLYDEPAPANLVHYTAGVPFFPETKGCEYSEEWWTELKAMNSAVSWNELMGNSVHVKRLSEWHRKRAANP